MTNMIYFLLVLIIMFQMQKAIHVHIVEPQPTNESSLSKSVLFTGDTFDDNYSSFTIY